MLITLKPDLARSLRKLRPAALLLASCNTSGPQTFAATEAGQQTVTRSSTGAAVIASPAPQVGFDSFLPFGSLASARSMGNSGAGSDDSQYPANNEVSSLRDRIVGKYAQDHDEECDDGEEGSVACTADCQTRDRVVSTASNVAEPTRHLGLGRHPVSASDDGSMAVDLEFADDAQILGATVCNRFGRRVGGRAVSAEASPALDANPVRGGGSDCQWSARSVTEAS